MERKRKRGYAYMRFRNDGYSIHVDFESVNVPWLEPIIRGAMQALRANGDVVRDGAAGGADAPCPGPKGEQGLTGANPGVSPAERSRDPRTEEVQ